LPEKISIVQIGGSIDRALKGDYKIDVKATLTEAWQLTLKSRVAINLGLLFSLLLGMLVSFVISNYLGGIEAVLADRQASMLVNVVVTIAVWPFIAGVEMMGVLHAVGMKSHVKMTFGFLNRASWIVLCALFTSLLTSIGFQLFVLPGLFLAITLSLTIPLLIEKKMMPIKAVVVSIQALRFQILPLFLLHFILLMSLVMLLFPFALLIETSVAPLGILCFLFGFTYLAPLFYNVKGILYREIFGVSIATDKAIDELERTTNTSVSKSGSDPDDTFTA